MIVIDEDQFEAVELKNGTMKLVEKNNDVPVLESKPTAKLKVA